MIPRMMIRSEAYSGFSLLFSHSGSSVILAPREFCVCKSSLATMVVYQCLNYLNLLMVLDGIRSRFVDLLVKL